MWIEKHHFGTDIYPFINQETDTAFSSRIAVTLHGRVRWRDVDWTPDTFAEYVAKLSEAMAKAFELAKAK